MTNELSKQICEICKIKDNVDFVEAENFVKLFELITSIEDVELRIGNYYIKQIPTHRQQTCLWVEEKDYYSENTNPIIAFLSCVFQGTIHFEYLRQAIREAEWKYE